MSSLKRIYILFFMMGLVLTALAGWQQRAPGYMDADYYYAGGLILADGGGLRHPMLWNYLDAPSGLPVAGFTYWMPLAALLSAVGTMLGGGFLTARLPFWLCAALISPLTIALGMALHADRKKAVLGGVFALFPAYYVSYLPTTDVFALYMALGAGVLLLIRTDSVSPARWFLLGLLCGLMHLARADGIYWFAAGLVAAAVPVLKQVLKRHKPDRREWLLALTVVLFVIAGYLVPMSFWYMRNLQTWGSLLPPGNGKTLWLTRYEDTFIYPASQLTVQRWAESGIGEILAVRGEALLGNFQTSVAVQGSILLFPFILVGLFQLRQRLSVRMGVVMWGITFITMTLIFPYAGINGSFFHSGAALQPLFWAAAPPGIEAAVGWVSRRRDWTRGDRVVSFVNALAIVVCVILSMGLYIEKVLGDGAGLPSWNRSDFLYRGVESRLKQEGATPCLAVMVNNPPGFFAVSQRPSLVIPYGDEAMVLAAASHFGASYLVLEENDAEHLNRLYYQPGDYPGFRYLGSVAGRVNDEVGGAVRIYAFEETP